MNQKRTVVGSQSTFFPEGSAFTVPGAGTASISSKPGATDPAWLALGGIKWSKEPTTKTETYMAPAPGAYVAQDEVVLSRGLTLKGKLELQSNFAYQLATATAALPVSPTAGGVYNELAGSPVVRGWLHIQEYDQNNVLINTVDRWVALKASGATNNDDKAAETPVEAVLLFSTLNVGTLA
jgi:hypothetical protein